MLPETCLGKLQSVILGFAYHSKNNDYKVVRISCLSSTTHEIEVYALSLDSWRKLGITFTTNTVFYDYSFLSSFPLVSGALHWMARSIEEEEQSFDIIMAFDVNTEKFRKLALPDGLKDAYYSQTYLALFKKKLAFITSDSGEQPSFRYSIWVMTEYGVVESWNKLFVVPFERAAYCFAFTEYGSLLKFWCIHSPVEKKKYKFHLINAKTLQQKKDLDIQYPSFVATYMESLVLLDGPNTISY